MCDFWVFGVGIACIGLEDEVFYEGPLLLRIVNEDLVIAGREESTKDEEVQFFDVVGREVGQVYCFDVV